MTTENFRIRWDRITALAIFVTFAIGVTVAMFVALSPSTEAAHWDTEQNGCYHGRDIALNGGEVPTWLDNTENYGVAFTTCYTEAQTNLESN